MSPNGHSVEVYVVHIMHLFASLTSAQSGVGHQHFLAARAICNFLQYALLESKTMNPLLSL
jgi:hypothetical protein